MAINWIAMAIAAALAAASAYVSAKAAAKTQKAVSKAIITGLDEQDKIDKKQREVVQNLLPEVDQKAQDKFLTQKDLDIQDSLAKTSKMNQASRGTDIAIAGKITGFKGERRKAKTEAEVKYNNKRFHLARYLAPNTVPLFLDPKLNNSASMITEYGVQKASAGRIANIDAQWKQHNTAGGLKGLATALNVASMIVGVGWGTTAEAGKQAVQEGAKQAAVKGAMAGGTQAGIEASKVAAQSALGAGSLSAGQKAAYSTLSGASRAGIGANPNLLAPMQALAFDPTPFLGGINNMTDINRAAATVPDVSASQGDVTGWTLSQKAKNAKNRFISGAIPSIPTAFYPNQNNRYI